MKITLPLSVTIPRKTKADKVFILNLNNYRNTHYMTLNQAKVIFSDIVGAEVMHAELPDASPYRFTYTVYPATNRKFDIANVCSIIDKFTCDALAEYGIIPDDCHKIIPVVVYQLGEVDRENPRVELQIDPIGGAMSVEETIKIAEETFL